MAKSDELDPYLGDESDLYIDEGRDATVLPTRKSTKRVKVKIGGALASDGESRRTSERPSYDEPMRAMMKAVEAMAKKIDDGASRKDPPAPVINVSPPKVTVESPVVNIPPHKPQTKWHIEVTERDEFGRIKSLSIEATK